MQHKTVSLTLNNFRTLLTYTKHTFIILLSTFSCI